MKSAMGKAFDVELAKRLAVDCKQAIDEVMSHDQPLIEGRMWWDDGRRACCVSFWCRAWGDVYKQELVIHPGTPGPTVASRIRGAYQDVDVELAGYAAVMEAEKAVSRETPASS